MSLPTTANGGGITKSLTIGCEGIDTAMEFALVDITEQAERRHLAVGEAWIENAIPCESFPAVLDAAIAAMTPVAPCEIRRITIRVTTFIEGALTTANLSLVLRHNTYGVLTAVILA